MAKRKLIFLTGWKYYNHALLRDCAPHEDTPIIINNNVFQGGGQLYSQDGHQIGIVSSRQNGGIV